MTMLTFNIDFGLNPKNEKLVLNMMHFSEYYWVKSQISKETFNLQFL